MPSASDHILPPTQQLPPIKSLRLESDKLKEIRAAIEYLRGLYSPQVRGSSRRKAAPTSGDSSVSGGGKINILRELESSDAGYNVNSIRIDSFERSFAIRWLTNFIAYVGSREPPSSLDQTVVEGLLQSAASLLAACSGAAATGILTRTFTFGPSPKGEEVQISITDAPLENQDYSSVGAQTWGGACVLSEMILDDPSAFAIPEPAGTGDRNSMLRVLELGAGTGLVGLTVYKLLAARKVQSSVVLTDFHPSVLKNLQGNVRANRRADSLARIDIARLDWEAFPQVADTSECDEQLTGTFDLILGADIIYEDNHALWIKGCLERLLHRPSLDSPSAIFHLVIPLRITHALESSTVEKMFSFETERPLTPSCVVNLAITHRERIICDAHGSIYDARYPDRVDEVEYAYYRIGWVRGDDSCT